MVWTMLLTHLVLNPHRRGAKQKCGVARGLVMLLLASQLAGA
jgi:hypothetical protein